MPAGQDTPLPTDASRPPPGRCWSATAGPTPSWLPAMAEHVLATCPVAEASWYEGVGHTPHLEQPDRFNRELAALTRRVS
jgi:pimeloyl-ACP methyl ester carboxylesterase